MFIVIVVLLSGCADQQRHGNYTEYNHFHRGGGLGKVDLKALGVLGRVKTKIFQAADIDAGFTLSPDPEPNAFATIIDGRPHIFFNTGLIKVIGVDKDEYAFIVAHECAHIVGKHFEERKKRERKSKKIEGIILGAVEVVGLAFGVPVGIFSMMSVDSGSHLVGKKFSRDQEFAADKLALQYMTKAGYDLHGALSFHNKVLSRSKAFFSILSTHPSGKDRIAGIHSTINEMEKREKEKLFPGMASHIIDDEIE